MNFSHTSQDFLDGVRAALHSLEQSGSEIHIHDAQRVFLIGNGGSSAICSHIANDLTKQTKIAAYVFSDAAVLTCIANDYGYENTFKELLRRHLQPRDFVIAVSSSGQSENILRAARYAKTIAHVITLSGFDADNPLRSIGHLNYYVPSHNYGIVEIAHLSILHSIVNPGS